MRFSLMGLLLATAVIALGAAAVVHRTSLWTNLVVTLTLAITVGCTITAWASPARRSFCLPFAVVAWVYLATIYLEPLGVGIRLGSFAGLLGSIREVSPGPEDNYAVDGNEGGEQQPTKWSKHWQVSVSEQRGA